ncbi:hypothetical protein EW146_g519 [Bondarzewia mesenterica]|uniref:superoxide dismutase n=1 Tax=Bondarzewia mesenterica TaxID=1095465 RepID=A0A4S4M8Y2_9AGAM|nr:hypothetical protein EW146_g519 [Bondarzewia mesenterica]
MFSLARSAARPVLTRAFNAAPTASLHTLPDLPYPYDALEPHISKEIMTLHHTKHHQTYVNGLNAAEDAYAKSKDMKQKIALQSALKFNGGGHINHSLFWKNLAPASGSGGQFADGPLKSAIVRDFGSVDAFKKKFNTVTAAIQGSGWGWLVRSPPSFFAFESLLNAVACSGIQPDHQKFGDCHHPESGPSHLAYAHHRCRHLGARVLSPGIQFFFLVLKVPISSTPFPLRTKYKNVKPDYLNAIWNVINFKEAELRFAQAEAE